MPRQGLGNSAIASVANDEQLERFGGKWAAMAITEPEAGSDSAAIRTTAVLDGDEYVLNGEKIYVTSGERADLSSSGPRSTARKGRAAIKSFVVERSNPGLKLDRLEHKLGIRASDTADFRLEDCRVPKENLLGTPEIDTSKGFGGRRCRPSTTRARSSPPWRSALARACWRRPARRLAEAGVEIDWDARRQPSTPPRPRSWRWRPTTRRRGCSRCRPPGWPTTPSRTRSRPRWPRPRPGALRRRRAALRASCAAASATARATLLEKWARDAKILDIFEGTQQIQLLIVARQLLGKTSAELR